MDMLYSSIEKLGTFYVVMFTNSKGNSIRLKNLPGGSTVGVDSEGAKVENIPINNSTAQYFQKGETNNLVFKLNESAYYIVGIVSKDEMIHIAESMKLFNQ